MENYKFRGAGLEVFIRFRTNGSRAPLKKRNDNLPKALPEQERRYLGRLLRVGASFFERDGEDFGGRVRTHGDAIEDTGARHRLAIVRNHDEL